MSLDKLWPIITLVCACNNLFAMEETKIGLSARVVEKYSSLRVEIPLLPHMNLGVPKREKTSPSHEDSIAWKALAAAAVKKLKKVIPIRARLEPDPTAGKLHRTTHHQNLLALR